MSVTVRQVMIKNAGSSCLSIVPSLLTPGWFFSDHVLLWQTPRCLMSWLGFPSPLYNSCHKAFLLGPKGIHLQILISLQ